MSTTCCVSSPKFDQQVAKKLGDKRFSPPRIALLRGIYEETYGEAIDTNDIEGSAAKLKELSAKLGKSKKLKFDQSSSLAMKKLNRAYTAKDRARRTAMLSDWISLIVDDLRVNNPSLTRSELLKGKDGIGGIENIIDFLYRKTRAYYKHYTELANNASNQEEAENHKEKADEYLKILDNWASFIPFVKGTLLYTEGVRIGNRIEFVADASERDMGLNNLDDIFNPEEATRESWQNESGTISAFGTVGAKVRRFLSTISALDEDGKEIVDDLGWPVKLNPLSTHQALLDILCGAPNSNEMMKLLKDENGEPRFDFLKPIIEGLENDEELKTAFFVDFKKNFVPYYALSEKIKDGILEVKTILLNKTENLLFARFANRVRKGIVLNSSVSIYDENGVINTDNLKKLRKEIEDWLAPLEKMGKEEIKDLTHNQIWDLIKTDKRNKFYTRGGNIKDRKSFVKNSLHALGIDITEDQLNVAYNNDKQRNIILRNLYELVSSNEISSILSQIETNSKKEKAKPYTYKNILNRRNRDGNYIWQEKMRKITDALTSVSEGLKMESRITWQNAKGKNITQYSHVNPNYMGDTFDRIKSFVDRNDKKGLKQWIEENYLGSSFFRTEVVNETTGKKETKILNKWLEELWNACDENNKIALSDDRSFAKHFSYMRMLGKRGRVFEDFTDAEHMVDMIAQFRSVETTSQKNKDRAMYPTFILGDSGASKYIEATRYTPAQIVSFMKDTFEQEKIRMQMVKDSEEWLNSQDNGVDNTGYNAVRNFRLTGDRFTILTFLNEDYENGYYYEKLQNGERVEDIFYEYMENALNKFKKDVADMGILDKPRKRKVRNGDSVKEVLYYERLGKNVTNENLDDVLRDFYYNSRFAMSQQLQIMTTDPSFYGFDDGESTTLVGVVKDLQKRYKEIHAPGTVLDIFATKNGERVCRESGKQHVLYFNDLKTDAGIHNSEFMDVVKYWHGETNPKLVEKYMNNTLTDGQGYRTLDSYRAVLVMGAKWTDEMEAAYQAIKKLRNEYGYSSEGYAREIPQERLNEIRKLAVVFQPIKPYLYTTEHLSTGHGTDYIPVPVQHKYAEAVLIPELMRDGKLKDTALYMDHNDIDMICSDKSVKVGIFGTTDISQAKDRASMHQALTKAYKHELNYSDYRIQTNVPEHFNTAQLFGTQIRKLIMAGLNLDSNKYRSYIEGGMVTLRKGGPKEELTGRNLMSFWNSLIMANMMESYDKFSDIVSDKKKLETMLAQGVINNGRMGMDALLAFALNSERDFTSPLYEGAINHDAEALFTSLFKKMVNKQTIKGGSAVQVSAMGLEGYEEDGGLKYITNPEKTNILYAECEIPFNFSWTDAGGNEIQLDFNDYCDKDGYLLDENNKPIRRGENGEYDLSKSKLEKRFPGMLNLVAYRIPTEKEYSMMNLKAVRFSNMMEGGTIKVPPQGTTVAGFDFDIDKLYFMMKEFKANPLSDTMIAKIWNDFYNSNPEIKKALQNNREMAAQVREGLVAFLKESFEDNSTMEAIAEADEGKDRLYKYWKEAGLEGTPQEAFASQLASDPTKYVEWVNYDTSKTANENDRVARNNMMLDLMRARLSDEETIKERTTPGGFVNASSSAKLNRFLAYGELSEILSGENVKIDDLSKLADNRKSADPEPEFDVTDPMTMIRYNQQNQIASKLIGIFANANTNYAFSTLTKSITLKDGMSLAFADRTKEDEPRDLRNTSYETAINMAEFLAASVDAVKDPVLNYLNLNEVTADAGAVLARLGYNMKEIGLLFNQPIIKELCNLCKQDNMYANTAIKTLQNKYKSKAARVFEKGKDTRDTSKLTKQELANNIVNNRKDESKMDKDKYFIADQLEILDLFDDILSVTSAMSNFTLSTKFTAANSVGSTMGSLLSQEMRVESFIENQADSPVVIVAADNIDSSTGVGNVLSNSTMMLEKDSDTYIEDMIGNPFGYEQLMYDLQRKCLEVGKEYFPYYEKSYTDARELFKQLSYGNTLNEELINQIHEDILAYMLSQQTQSMFNGNNTFIDMPEGCKNVRDYYRNYFPLIFADIVETNPDLVGKYPILNYIALMEGKSGDKATYNLRAQSAGGTDASIRDTIMQSWADMAKSEDANEQKLAQDMFFYCFHKLGFGFSPMSFMNLAPTELKELIQVETNEGETQSYLDFCRDILDGNPKSFDLKDFAEQFLLNHLEHKRFSTTAYESQSENNDNKKDKDNDLYKYITKDSPDTRFPTDFTVDTENMSDFIASRVIQKYEKDEENDKEYFTYKPIIAVETANGGTVYYMCTELGKTESAQASYVRANAKGETNSLLTYDSQNNTGSLVDGRTSYFKNEEVDIEGNEDSNIQEDQASSDNTSDSFSPETTLKIDNFLDGYDSNDMDSFRSNKDTVTEILSQVYSEIDMFGRTTKEWSNIISDDFGNKTLKSMFDMVRNNYKKGRNVLTIDPVTNELMEVC